MRIYFIYVITTIESDQIAYEIRAQCSKMRVEARKYGDLIRERSYVTGWNRIDYSMLLMSCAIKGRDIGEELRKLKETTGKKILIFYGNCQTGTLNSLALTSKKIGDKFFIMVIPPVQNLSCNEREQGIPDEVLDNLDVLFYQHVNYANWFSKKLGTDTILQRINRWSQVKICIPNVYYSGTFPQMTCNRYQPTNVGDYAVGAGPFPGDGNIEKMWVNMSAKEIAEKLLDENFYNHEEVRSKADLSMDELRKREEICDVVISDYIQENLTQERLFFIPNHPRVKVILELMKRAFSKLGIDVDDVNAKEVAEPDIQVIPIYPSIRKALYLEHVDDICYEPSLPEKPSDMRQYVSAYIKYCKPLYNSEKRAQY